MYYVYVLASGKNGTLYVGMASDLLRRVAEHKDGSGNVFTSKYGVGQLVYYEEYASKEEAAGREKQLKHWRRAWKIKLIERENREWMDLSGTISQSNKNGSSAVKPK